MTEYGRIQVRENPYSRVFYDAKLATKFGKNLRKVLVELCI